MSIKNSETSQSLSGDSQKASETYAKLNADDKLALLYLAYEAMGDEITPAAPTVAEPNLAPLLLGDFYSLSQDEQLAMMRQIANCEDNEYSRAYGALTANNQLLVLFAWAQAMGDTVVDMPDDYQPTSAVNNLLQEIEKLDFQQQISVLREIAGQMGFQAVKQIPTQAETGKTASL